MACLPKGVGHKVKKINFYGGNDDGGTMWTNKCKFHMAPFMDYPKDDLSHKSF